MVERPAPRRGATEANGDLVARDGTRVGLEVSAAPLMNGKRVVGVFRLVSGLRALEAVAAARQGRAFG